MFIKDNKLYNELLLLTIEKFKLKIKTKSNDININKKEISLLKKIKKKIAKINTLISIKNKLYK